MPLGENSLCLQSLIALTDVSINGIGLQNRPCYHTEDSKFSYRWLEYLQSCQSLGNILMGLYPWLSSLLYQVKTLLIKKQAT